MQIHPKRNLPLRIILSLFLLSIPTAQSKPAQDKARFSEAEGTYRQGQWENALHLYERLAQEYPQMPSAHEGVALCFVKLKDYPRAIIAFHRALELLPNAPRLQGELADVYRQNHQFNAAEKWYRRAIDTAKEDAAISSYIGLGLVETGRGNYEEARQHYMSAIRHHPNAAAAYYHLGTALLNLNELDEADAAFRKALEQEDTMAFAFFRRGQVAAKRHQFDIARSLYARAIQLDANKPSFHYAQAQVFFRAGELEQGQKALARYRRTTAQACLTKARGHREKKQWKKALTQLLKAVEVDADFTDAISECAYVQMQLGEFDAAKKGYAKVLETHPNTPLAQFYLGIIETELGNLDAAESIFLKTIRTTPDFMDSYVQLGGVRRLKGDLKGAEATFDMAIMQSPQWAAGYWWRGQMRQKQGNVTGAEADFRHTIVLAPEIPLPKNSLARLLAFDGRSLDEALTLANTVMADGPSPEHRATLALVYQRLGRTEIAQREIKHAYENAPDNPDVRSIHGWIMGSPDARK
ncbi:MAG: tetratricopeptide repeat protein [Candidatus Poribacteria bacterium]|nr:tetratricopeptide repeat protein [Candidatus Poribacteria bacterium]